MKDGDIYKTKFNGDLKIIDCSVLSFVLVEFLDTGFRTTTRKSHIHDGNVKDPMRPSVYVVGFIGTGRHKVSVGGKITNKYNKWNVGKMLL